MQRNIVQLQRAQLTAEQDQQTDKGAGTVTADAALVRVFAIGKFN